MAVRSEGSAAAGARAWQQEGRKEPVTLVLPSGAAEESTLYMEDSQAHISARWMPIVRALAIQASCRLVLVMGKPRRRAHCAFAIPAFRYKT